MATATTTDLHNLRGKRVSLIMRNSVGALTVALVTLTDKTDIDGQGFNGHVTLGYKVKGSSKRQAYRYELRHVSVAIAPGWVVPQGMEERAKGERKGSRLYSKRRHSYSYPLTFQQAGSFRENVESLQDMENRGDREFDRVVKELNAVWVHRHGVDRID